MSTQGLNENKNLIAILGRDESQLASVEIYYKNAEFKHIHCFTQPAELIKFVSGNASNLHIVAILKDQNGMGWQPVAKAIRSQISTPVVLFIDMNDNLTENEQRFLSKLPDGSWLRTPLKQRARIINTEKTLNLQENTSELDSKLSKVKELYRKNISQSVKTVHTTMVRDFNSNNAGPEYIEKVRNGLLEIEKILNSELSGFNHNFEVLEYHIENGNEKEFEVLFNKLYEVYSNSKDSYWLGQLGELCLSLRLDVYVEKIIAYMESLDTDESKWRVKLLEARSNIMKNELEKAEISILLAESLSEDPKAEILNLKGILARRNGNFERALDHFEAAVQITKLDHRLYFNIALCYNSLAKVDEAIGGLRKALGIFPNYARAKSLLVRISQK